MPLSNTKTTFEKFFTWRMRPQGGKQSQNEGPGPGQELAESDPAFQRTAPPPPPMCLSTIERLSLAQTYIDHKVVGGRATLPTAQCPV
jgi:hypothetical protein